MEYKSFNEIVNSIQLNKNHLTLVKSPTGTGKSTLLVSELFNINMKIFIVSPTIISTKNLYKYMSSIIDKKIGYAADSQVKYNNKVLNKIRNHKNNQKDTSIVYCTPGHMKNILYDCIKNVKNNIMFCDYIILDEIHLGTIDISMIYRLWNYLNTISSNIPNMIQTSATYIDNEIITYEIKDNTIYDVEIFYLESSIDNIYSNIISYLNHVNHLEDDNIWLVFLPGIFEIELIINNISSDKYDIIIAHSSSNNIDDIYLPSKKSKRKLILSTNIAETSLTIPNCSFIIDSMIEKIPRETSSGSISLLSTKISKSSAQQRKGRTGRTCNGKVLRMCTEEEYEKLDEFRELEVYRLPLFNEIIKCLSLNINIKKIFNDISDEKINLSIQELKNINAIDNFNKITKLGEFITTIPISYKMGAFIFHWIENEFPIYSGIVLVSLIELSDRLLDVNFCLYSDIPLGSLINIWNVMCEEYEDINISEKDIKKYTYDYGINFQTFLELKKKILELLSIFFKNGYDIEPFIISLEEIYHQSYPILQNLYSLYIKKQNKNSYLKYHDGVKVKNLSSFQVSEQFLINNNIEEIIGIYTKKIGQSEKIILWIPYI